MNSPLLVFVGIGIFLCWPGIHLLEHPLIPLAMFLLPNTMENCSVSPLLKITPGYGSVRWPHSLLHTSATPWLPSNTEGSCLNQASSPQIHVLIKGLTIGLSWSCSREGRSCLRRHCLGHHQDWDQVIADVKSLACRCQQHLLQEQPIHQCFLLRRNLV